MKPETLPQVSESVDIIIRLEACLRSGPVPSYYAYPGFRGLGDNGHGSDRRIYDADYLLPGEDAAVDASIELQA